jgi:hypothetical protein
MVMAILLSIALGFALFIFSDINQAHMIDDSVLAYYGAESGFERTIYLFRKQDKNKIGSFLYSPTDPSSDVKALSRSDMNGTTTASNSKWTIRNSTDYESRVIRQHLKNGQGVKLFFLNRVNSLGEEGTNGVKSISVEWQKAYPCHLQVSFTQLRPQLDAGTLVNFSDVAVPLLQDSPTTGSIFCQAFLDKAKDRSTVWRSDYAVELKALGSGDDYCNDNLKVIGYLNNDCTSPVTTAITNVTIHSVGKHNKASQEIIAYIPPYDPVSGLLGFVLFSEQDITKSY